MAIKVTSVGTAGDNGDLLIGVQNMISVLGAEEYHPYRFVSIAKTCPKLDVVERVGILVRNNFILSLLPIGIRYDFSRVYLLQLNQQRRYATLSRIIWTLPTSIQRN